LSGCQVDLTCSVQALTGFCVCTVILSTNRLVDKLHIHIYSRPGLE